MDLGVKIPNLSALASRESLLGVARAAERCGYGAVWASDHLVFGAATVHDMPGRRFPVGFDVPAVDPLVALAAVAGATERVKLGTSVLVLANRNPVAIAKAWASIDLIAPGRVIAGVGTGWQEEEFSALGAGDRFRRRGSATDEFIEILRRCWSEETPSFHGEFYDLEPVHFHPQPTRPIPILLGGSSERGIRRVGRVGDGFHGTNLSPDDARIRIDEIRQAAVDAGRDPDALYFTTLCELGLGSLPVAADDHMDTHMVGSREEVTDRLGRFAEAGIEHVALRVRALSGSTRPGVEPALSLSEGIEQIEAMAEVM